MNLSKALGTLLIVAGVAGLVYGGFDYTRDKQTTQIGPLSLTVKDTRTVNVPIWAGVAAIVLGAGLLLIPVRK